MLVLLGIGVVVLGFVLRANPLLVVMAAALTTGLAAAWTPDADIQLMYQAALATLAAFGKAFNDNRYVSMVWFVLLAIGLLERSGLQERARMLIAKVQAATVGRVLWVYFVMRQVLSALGLTSLGGHAQTEFVGKCVGRATSRFCNADCHRRPIQRSDSDVLGGVGLMEMIGHARDANSPEQKLKRCGDGSLFLRSAQLVSSQNSQGGWAWPVGSTRISPIPI